MPVDCEFANRQVSIATDVPAPMRSALSEQLVMREFEIVAWVPFGTTIRALPPQVNPPPAVPLSAQLPRRKLSRSDDTDVEEPAPSTYTDPPSDRRLFPPSRFAPVPQPIVSRLATVEQSEKELVFMVMRPPPIAATAPP
jgi:hypothetical protein